jgi:hypothetical protein
MVFNLFKNLFNKIVATFKSWFENNIGKELKKLFITNDGSTQIIMVADAMYQNIFDDKRILDISTYTLTGEILLLYKTKAPISNENNMLQTIHCVIITGAITIDAQAHLVIENPVTDIFGYILKGGK